MEHDSPDDGPSAAGSSAADLGAELDRLRAENARLRDEADARAAERTAGRRRRRRAIGSVVLVVLGSVMLLVSVLTVWTRNQVLDTDQYVETVAPLASDPVIVSTLSNRISETVSDEIDVKSRAEEALPDNATFLAAPIAAGADTLIQNATTKLVGSDQFENAWVKANRAAHDGLVAAATGTETDIISTDDGKVVLKLSGLATEVVNDVDAQLGLDLASRIPTDRLDINFVLVDSSQLADLQTAVRMLNRLAWLSVILTLAFLGGAIAAAPDRRKAVVRVGLGAAIAMALLALGFGLGRDLFLTNLPDGVERPDAAAVIFDTLTRFVLQAVRVLFALGVAILVGAWLAGPSGAAVRLRALWNRILGRGSELTGSSIDLGPVPAWVARHVTALRATIVALAFVVLIAWDRPTGRVVLLIAVLTLVPLALVQLLAGVAPSESTGEAAGTDLLEGSEALAES